MGPRHQVALQSPTIKTQIPHPCPQPAAVENPPQSNPEIQKSRDKTYANIPSIPEGSTSLMPYPLSFPSSALSPPHPSISSPHLILPFYTPPKIPKADTPSPPHSAEEHKTANRNGNSANASKKPTTRSSRNCIPKIR